MKACLIMEETVQEIIEFLGEKHRYVEVRSMIEKLESSHVVNVEIKPPETEPKPEEAIASESEEVLPEAEPVT